MKKNNLIVLFCILMATMFSIKAQEELNLPNTYSVLHMEDSIPVSQYDTMVIFNPDIYANNCLFNYQVLNPNDPWPYRQLLNFEYYNMWQNAVNPLHFDNNGYIINEPNEIQSGDPLSNNPYKPEAFAQPYHLNNSVKMIGVAARVFGSFSIDAIKYSFHLLDEDFNELQKSVGLWWSEDGDDRYPLRFYKFMADGYPEGQNYIEVQDFYISADEDYTHTSSPTLRYARTLSIFDTIWQDTLIGCQTDYSPYFKKNGEWRSFADDSVYQFYQKVFIEFLPVILAPRNTESSLNDDITNENLWLYPNPAKDFVEITSSFKIKTIDVVNMQGKRMFSKQLDNYMTQIDIHSLPQGSYIIKIHTDKGDTTRTIIKE